MTEKRQLRRHGSTTPKRASASVIPTLGTERTRRGEKPCPFCGSMDLDPSGGEEDTEHWIVCNDCGAQGPYATIGCRDDEEENVDLEEEARAAWNRRAVEPVGAGPTPSTEACRRCGRRDCEGPVATARRGRVAARRSGRRS